MPMIKAHIFKITLLCIILAAILLAVSAISNYTGDTTSSQYKIGQPNPPTLQTNQLPKNMNHPPGGQFPVPNSAPIVPPNGGMLTRISNDGTKYAPQIIAYSIIFLIIIGYSLYTRRKIKIDPVNEKLLILTLLVVGLLLRISFATLVTGHPFDIDIFKRWAVAAANNLSQFYAGHNTSDYPPLYIYVLYIIGKIANIPAMNPYFTLLLKMPSIMADIATSLLIYKQARKYVSLEASTLLSAFYIFNPAVFMNSTYWGQVDSFFTLIVISSVILLTEQKIGPASVLFAAAVLMKPQGIIFIPVFFFELIRLKKFNHFLKAVVCAVSAIAVIILPFSLDMNVSWIFKLFSNTAAEYPFAAVNAFNLFSLLGANYKNDSATLLIFSYYTWGIIFIAAVTTFSWFLLIKGNSRMFVPAIALLQIAGVFTLSTRMHERYLFPAIALSIISFIYLRDKRLLLLAAGFSTTTYINTHFVLYETSVGINAISFGPTLILTSLLNILLLFSLAGVLFDVSAKKNYMHFDADRSVNNQSNSGCRQRMPEDAGVGCN